MANCNKPNYYECYAKVLLEELYPKEFANLEIKDKPDLQMKDGKYGIEVTNSVNEQQLKAEGIYADISCNGVRNEPKVLKKIKKCGCKLEKGILVGKSGTDSFELILSAFDDKLNKLNKDYICFKRNCLFIFSDIYADERMIMEAIQDMQQRQIEKERQFNEVFVLVPGECYRLNLDIGSYERYPIESERQFYHATKARELVKTYEKTLS
ncbi:MAG: hypothetical protein ACLSV2_01895 [Clostridium sp.]